MSGPNSHVRIALSDQNQYLSVREDKEGHIHPRPEFHSEEVAMIISILYIS